MNTTRRFNHRRHLHKLQKGKCFYCERLVQRIYKHKPPFNGREWTLDRIIPGAQGGTYRRENLVLACLDCNLERGIAPAEEFLRKKFAERQMDQAA